MERWEQESARQADTIQGACLVLRGKALKRVGLLDEDYYIYSEEVDLCYRLRKGGRRLFWVPQAEVVHYGGQSTQQVAAEMFLHLYRGKLIYFRKHCGRLATTAYKFILALASLARLAASPLIWLRPAPTREKYLHLTRSYRKLLLSLWEI